METKNKNNIDFKLCIYRTTCKLEVFPTIDLSGINFCIYPSNPNKTTQYSTYNYKDGERIRLNYEEVEKLNMFFLNKFHLHSERNLELQKASLSDTEKFFHKFQKGNISTSKVFTIGLKVNEKINQIQYAFTIKNIETNKTFYIYLSLHEYSMINKYCDTFRQQYQLLQYIKYRETYKEKFENTSNFEEYDKNVSYETFSYKNVSQEVDEAESNKNEMEW